MPRHKEKLNASEKRQAFVRNARFMLSVLKKQKKKSGRKVFWGVDSSISNPAFVIDDNKEVTVRSVITPTKDKLYKRFSDIVKIYSACINVSYPVLLLIEDYSYASPYYREVLAELQGQLKRLFWNNNIAVIRVAPRQLKKYVGASEKTKIMLNVFKFTGYSPENDDEADAYVLCMIAKDLYRYLTKYFVKGLFNIDREIFAHLKKKPKMFKYTYRWEVIKSLIENKGCFIDEFMDDENN